MRGSFCTNDGSRRKCALLAIEITCLREEASSSEKGGGKLERKREEAIGGSARFSSVSSSSCLGRCVARIESLRSQYREA